MFLVVCDFIHHFVTSSNNCPLSVCDIAHASAELTPYHSHSKTPEAIISSGEGMTPDAIMEDSRNPRVKKDYDFGSLVQPALQADGNTHVWRREHSGG